MTVLWVKRVLSDTSDYYYVVEIVCSIYEVASIASHLIKDALLVDDANVGMLQAELTGHRPECKFTDGIHLPYVDLSPNGV
jgi:hypothetical protein